MASPPSGKATSGSVENGLFSALSLGTRPFRAACRCPGESSRVVTQEFRFLRRSVTETGVLGGRRPWRLTHDAENGASQVRSARSAGNSSVMSLATRVLTLVSERAVNLSTGRS